MKPATPQARQARQARLRSLLRSVFDLAQLREGQQQVIDSVLDGVDTLAIMPTGSGKSLCYQLPTLMLPGATVVVSPLIALMQDQLGKVEDIGIVAAQVNSSLKRGEERSALDSIRNKIDDIIFCTPERLAMPDFLAVLKRTRVSLVVVDEAHCISQWGHDFRPAYLELAAAIDALGRPPVLALTATATEEVVRDIGRQLGNAGMRVINTGIYRANLHYRVTQCTSEEEKTARALRLMARLRGPGILYTATVKAAQEMHARLLAAGIEAALYHGKLRAAERYASQQRFMGGELALMVATNAFGMGIDKSDIRYVLHLQVPANLESYYQESGRAGRDGRGAGAILLYLQDDKRVQQFFLVKHYPRAEQLRVVHKSIAALAGQGAAIDFGAIHAANPALPADALRVCLKLLKDGQLLRQNRRLDYQLGPGAASAALFDELASRYQRKQEHDREALEKMVQYAQSALCRWKVLLAYFGDDQPHFERCGHCDNCRHPPQLQLAPGQAIASTPATLPRFVIGTRVRVPKFDVGIVRAVEGEKVTVEFPDLSTHTFMASYLAPA